MNHGAGWPSALPPEPRHSCSNEMRVCPLLDSLPGLVGDWEQIPADWNGITLRVHTTLACSFSNNINTPRCEPARLALPVAGLRLNRNV